MAAGVMDFSADICGTRPPAPASELWQDAQCFWKSCAAYGSSAANAVMEAIANNKHNLMGVPHFPTMCSTSFSFSVQTYSPMSSLGSSSDALVIFQGLV